ncbi:hypothetical protein F0562_018856 [Nyssa sinensis]|uniref:Stigma-specific STIG1-like protein 1 n=1 Tax=Nyssa sinensis TaxID=561372 RepID=A0A5J4Z9T6_9ASTE|nr:hypothetical protein F0562_018856 [Nyssa sinensis]
MESSKILFVMLLVMATTITLFAAPIRGELVVDAKGDNASDVHFPEGQEPFSLRGTGRFLAQSPRAVQTCDKYPRVCAAKGSAGPDCCKKQCVNVMTNKLNCGMCGKKSTSDEEELPFDDDEEIGTETSDIPLPESQKPSYLRGSGRFLAQTTCDSYPKICRVKGSPGRDCCNKKCVDLKTDKLNCGKCGQKCKYSEICCKGKCLNPLSDKKHCGSCNNKCKKGTKCVYGMCNYA